MAIISLLALLFYPWSANGDSQPGVTNSLAIVKAIGYPENRQLTSTAQAPFTAELVALKKWQAANPPIVESNIGVPQTVTYTPVERVVVQSPPTAPSVAQTAPAQPTDSLQQWLLTLRNCESGGDYTKNTGNGFYGAYQFSEATWDSWDTGYAFANEAPPSVQDAAIIENTNNSAGLVTQNPGCYYKTGISNKPPQ